jgi:hypothetical protein
MKPTALVYGVAFAIWMGLVAERRPTRGTLAIAGAAVLMPALLVMAWLYLNDNVRDAWVAVVEYNRAYVTAGAGLGQLVLELAKVTWRYVKIDPVWTAGFCAMVAAVVELGRSRRIVPVPALCACWLAAAAVAIAANGIRMYSTYFIPPVPALAMAVAWMLVEWPGRRRWLLAASIVAVAIAVAVSRGSAVRLVRTTAADWAQLSGTDRNLNLYLEQFGGYATGRGYSARANAELAEYIARQTQPGDRIYIFGMAPSVYLLSRRLPANRFLWAYPAVSNAVRRDIFTLNELVISLEASRPRLLILERNNRDSLMGWKIEQNFNDAAMIQLLATYRVQAEIEDFIVYVRESGV